MGTGQDVIIVVDGERRGFPARLSGMTGTAVGRNIDGGVIWICRLNEILGMAAVTNRRSSDIPVCVAFDALS